MHLHGEVGPRHTTVSAIAKRAGVERLTVYRHFANESEMFQACSHLYLEQNPPPRPEDWKGAENPIQRTRRGLEVIYGYFSRTASMFENIYRDTADFASLKEIMDGFEAYLRSLADDLAGDWPTDSQPRIRTILRLATRFSFWQTMEAEELGDGDKVSILMDWLLAAGKD